MKYRILATFLISIFAINVNANMASPILEGTHSGLTFINRSVDVLSEQLLIKPDQLFNSATVEVKYLIEADSTGAIIPLVFHAEGYKDGIEIKFDGKKIAIEETFPARYSNFHHMGLDTLSEGAVVKWGNHSYLIENYADLKYFEVDISEGKHVIEVNYVALPWIDRSDWVQKRSFYYSLSPIKYWRSVGDIEVTVDLSAMQESTAQTVTTNLGAEKRKEEDAMTLSWIIKDIEEDYIIVEHQPTMSSFSKLLIGISPGGLSILFLALMIALHLRSIYVGRFSSNNFRNFVVYAGGVCIPILTFFFYLYTYSFIDKTLGGNASDYHGYTFLTIFLVPFVIIFYTFLTYWYRRALNTGQ